jgi:glycosyltransferase involved in cell wall biosynthesis
MPKISVIITTYNRAHFVREAIESVLNQTYSDYEIIVVDDGSKDNTREVVNSIPDPRIRYMYQENRGVCGAMNAGIMASKAECVAFLDSDNVLFKTALQKSMAFMDRHPEVGFCYGQISTMDERGRPLRIKRFRGPKVTAVNDGKKELVNLLLGERNIGHFIARTSCVKEVGLFNTELRMSEDWDMWIRLARRCNVGHIAAPMVKARYHTQSLTAKSGVEIVKCAHTAVLESVFQDPELGPLYGYLRKRAYFGLNCLLARMAALTGHKSTAIKYFAKAIGIYPGVFVDVRALSLIIRSLKVFLPQRLRRIIIEILIRLCLR